MYSRSMYCKRVKASMSTNRCIKNVKVHSPESCPKKLRKVEKFCKLYCIILVSIVIVLMN